MLAKLAPYLIPALVGAMVAIGGGVFTFGQQLGDAQATARFWERYVEGLGRMPEECRR